jgi:hypothetical protein
MNNQTVIYVFFGIFCGLWIIILLLDKKYFMLRDASMAQPRPFSWSRVQMTWWTVIVLTAFITVIVRTSGQIPTFNDSTLYMLGISSATIVSSTLIDISDRSNPSLTSLGQDMKGVGMIMDILSDKNGINIHRFQNFLFNMIFGIWFLYESLQHLFITPNCKVCTNPADMKACVDCMTAYANSIMPVITPNNLVLLGVSSGVYAAMKTTENKQPSATASPQTTITTTVIPASTQPAQQAPSQSHPVILG